MKSEWENVSVSKNLNYGVVKPISGKFCDNLIDYLNFLDLDSYNFSSWLIFLTLAEYSLITLVFLLPNSFFRTFSNIFYR